MSKIFTLLGLGLLAVCAIWAWVSLRKYAARKCLQEERATAFMVEAMNSMKRERPAADKIRRI